jgi:hypothetical protein
MKWGINSKTAEKTLRMGFRNADIPVGKALAFVALFALTGNAAVIHYVSPVSPAPAAP